MEANSMEDNITFAQDDKIRSCTHRYFSKQCSKFSKQC